MSTFIENVNTVANATVLATGDIIEDATIARDAAEASAAEAASSATNAASSETMSELWATKQYNNPVEDGKFSAYHWSVVAADNSGGVVINDAITSLNYTWSSSKLSGISTSKADVDHLHVGVYEPAVTAASAYNKSFTTSGGVNGVATTVARGDHVHTGIYEPAIGTKKTAFNKDFGTTAGTVALGEHLHTGTYMPFVTASDAYNAPFVSNPLAPLSTEVPRGNHIHYASGLSYDNSGDDIITATTVQGGMSQLDASLSNITVEEKCKVGVGMTGTTQVVTINTAGVGEKLVTAMTVNSASKNALYSGGDIVVDYTTTPDNLIEGWYSATVSIDVAANKEYEIALWVDDVIVDTLFRSQVGASTSAATGIIPVTLDCFVSGLSNGARLGLAVYNITDTTNITVHGHTATFAGQPEGSIVASGLSVDHADLTGTGAALGVHTIADISGDAVTLTAQLANKTELTPPSAADNIATLDIAGGLTDSGVSITTLSNSMSLVGGTPTADNFVSMSAGGDSLDSGYSHLSFASLGGSATQVFEVDTGISANDAVTLTQLNAVSTVADAAIPVVTTPTTGNFPQLSASGELVNSAYDETSFATASHTHAIVDVTGLSDALDDTYPLVSTPATDNLVAFQTGDLLQDTGIAYTDIMQDVSDDTTPTLGGDLDASNKVVDNVKSVMFNSIIDNGTKTAAWTYVPEDGQYQKVTINAACTMTITAPTSIGTFYLHVYQGATGGALTLPTGKWVGGTVKANTLTASTGHDLLMVHYMGGTDYVFEYMLDLS